MGNVCAINWLYKWPVKLYSTHLWLTALFFPPRILLLLLACIAVGWVPCARVWTSSAAEELQPD